MRLNFVLLLNLFLLVATNLSAQDSGQDRVTYRPKKNEQPITRSGTIADFNGQFLTLKLEKLERKIPTERIVDVQTKWLAEHLQGDEQKAQNHFVAASKLYLQALQIEPRPWVKRLIRNHLVECYRESGLWLQAVDQFQKIVVQESQTRFFDQIPLAWNPLPPNAGLRSQALNWIEGNDSILALIGCSYSISGPNRQKALDRLNKLTQSKDKRVSQLAEMQIWRSRIITASSAEVRTWQKKIRQVPNDLRVGGYLVIGSALAYAKKEQAAATELMRIPIHYARHHRLAAFALMESHKLVQKTNPPAATKLLAELARNYSDTTEGQQAESMLKNKKGLGQPNK